MTLTLVVFLRSHKLEMSTMTTEQKGFVAEQKGEREVLPEKGLIIPDSYYVMPIRNTVFFPRQFLPFTVGRESSLLVVDEAIKRNIPILVLAQRNGEVEKPGLNDLYTVGTVAQVLKVYNLPNGAKSVLLQGLSRARVLSFLQFDPLIRVIAQRIQDSGGEGEKVTALVAAIRNTFHRLTELTPELSDEHLSILLNIEDPGGIADIATSFVNVSIAEKQQVLEEFNVQRRLEKTHLILTKLSQQLEWTNKIQSEVQAEINKNQREYYLREQLKAIKKELGESSENIDLRDLRKRLKKANLPKEVRTTAEKEIERLAEMHPSSAEYTVARTYVEWLLDLPWKSSTQDNLDLEQARRILDRDHYGLEKVKKRILEYLAVRKLKNDMRGPILCFVGAPGVGKTSLGRSIAEALGRKFVRISLGGVHDEAEIRGHRRTYVGALPGRILQGLKRAGSNNPVFMLDEIDKVGTDFRGDPSSALLEVLDPEQNSTFSDHYIELPFDLSRVLFIATANMLEPIPPPLRDRMEIIEIPSYILDEKLHIAKGFLIPKQIKEHGLTPRQIGFEDEAIRTIIMNYTREAGVRELERRIAEVCRGVARDIVEGKTTPTTITNELLPHFLGQKKYYPEVAERINKPGIATGLAWTPVGGDILFIEATKMRGKGNLILTGQLGEVMKESAQAALSYIASHARQLGIDESFREQYDIHLHIPAGAIPKDGPSAGVAILAALTSLLTGRLVRNDVAMTGEITLRGAVLPIGGVKEKVLAAHRAAIRQVILPERNRHSLEEMPQWVLDDMKFHFVKEMLEVIEIALMPRSSSGNGHDTPANTAIAEPMKEGVSDLVGEPMSS
jgi:ATP-dependent Lon protease